MEKSDEYWQRWENLLEAAANLQQLFPDAVLIGGSAAAVHVHHRYSFDADHVLTKLESCYESVLNFLEARDDWKSARLSPPKLILGNFQGIETGLRQLRRSLPLETVTISFHGKQLTIPTLAEMIRTKAWMIVCRNATRDYIDFAALVDRSGFKEAIDALKHFDCYYFDLIRKSDALPSVQLIRQLAEPKPFDLDSIDVSQYKGIQEPLGSWNFIKRICENMSVQLTE